MKYNDILKNKKAKQFFVLYSSTVIGLLIGVGVSVLNTRILGPEDYGDFKYIHGVYSFLTLIVSFGYFPSIGRLMLERDKNLNKKEIIGGGIVVTLILGLVFSLSIVWFSFIQKWFFPKDLQAVFLILSPLMFVMPFKMSYEYLFQGSNQIYELAFLRQAPRILYIIVLLLLSMVFKMGVVSATVVEVLTFALIVIIVSMRLKPDFSNLKKSLGIINEENKNYGNHVYFGSLFGVASTHFGPIILSYFSTTNVDVGYFSLAVLITMPLVMIPNIVGTTMFSEFAKKKKISKKITMITFSISATALLFFVLFTDVLVHFLYSEAYSPAIPLIKIMAAAQIFHGYGNFYNRFLGAHGQGKKIRNGSIYVGIANFAGFFILIPFLGAYGAAYVKVLSGFVYLASMYLYYHKFSNKLISEGTG